MPVNSNSKGERAVVKLRMRKQEGKKSAQRNIRERCGGGFTSVSFTKTLLLKVEAPQYVGQVLKLHS